MTVTRVRPLQRTEWPQGTQWFGVRVETWPAVHARHQPPGWKKGPAWRVGWLINTLLLLRLHPGVCDRALIAKQAATLPAPLFAPEAAPPT